MIAICGSSENGPFGVILEKQPGRAAALAATYLFPHRTCFGVISQKAVWGPLSRQKSDMATTRSRGSLPVLPAFLSKSVQIRG